MSKISAKKAYYDWRVYQHFLKDLNLQDDSSSITVEDLNAYIANNIDEDTYKELLDYCLKTY